MSEQDKTPNVVGQPIDEVFLTPGGQFQEEEVDSQKETEQETHADPRLNQAIPMMVAKVVFKSPPTSQLPQGTSPTENSNLAEQYVMNTSPLLELISFHECLGAVGNLSPSTRLMIGAGILGLNILLLKPKTKKHKNKEEEKDTEQTKPEE